MNTDNYLEGFRTGTIDITRFGLDVAKKVRKELTLKDEFSNGYNKAIEMTEAKYNER